MERYARRLIQSWKSILAVSLAATVLGGVYAFTASPIYHSEAILAPKPTPGASVGAGLLSQFGGMGGLVASQLGMGNTSFDNLEIVATSDEFIKKIIAKYGLAPYLFPKDWDGTRSAWKEGKVPTLGEAAAKLRSQLTVEFSTRKKILFIGLNFPDSVMVQKVVEYFLVELDDQIKQDVRADADSNRNYLQLQLSQTADPLLREKIQQLISTEIEKAMLISSNTFIILDHPTVPEIRIGPKKKQILGTSFLVGLILSSMAVIASMEARRVVSSLRSSLETISPPRR